MAVDGTILIDTKIDGEGAEKGIGKLMGSATRGSQAVGAAVIAIGAAMVASVAKFAEFEGQMNEVFTLLPGISGAAMDEMTGQVKDFAKEFGTLPNEVVPALYQAISAGVPKDNVFDFLEVAQKAAIAGVTELETAVDGISSVVNAYGSEVISAAEASDLMFMAVKGGKTTFEELSGFLYQVIPTASALGVEFGDVTAALATMTAAGTPTRVATTQLRQAFVELSKDGGETATLFQDLAGQTFKQFIAEGGNTQAALQLLEKHAQDTGVGVNDLFASVEAGNAVLALTGTGTEKFASELAASADAAGATETAYAVMEQGLGRSFERIKASFAVALLDIGEALAPLALVVAGWVESIDFSAIVDSLGKLEPILPLIAAGIAGALVPALYAAAAGVWAVMAPLLPFIAAGVAIGAIVTLLVEHFGGWSAVVDKVKAAIAGAWAAMEPLRDVFAETFANLQAQGGPIMERFKAIWEDLQPVLTAVAVVVGVVLAVAMGLLMGVINGVLGALGGLIRMVQGVIAIVTNVFKLIVGVVTGDGDMIKEAVAGIGEGIEDVFGGLWDTIEGYLTGFIDGVVGFFTGLYDTLVGNSIIPDMINDIVDWFLGLPGKVADTLSEFVTNVVTAMLKVATTAIREAGRLVSGIIRALRASPIFGPLLNAITGALDTLRGMATAAATAGRSLVMGIWNGINDKFQWLVDKVRTFASNVTDKLKSFFGISSPSKLFEKEIGVNLALGIGKGFAGQVSDVVGAMSRGVSAEMGRFAMQVPGVPNGASVQHIDNRRSVAISGVKPTYSDLLRAEADIAKGLVG